MDPGETFSIGGVPGESVRWDMKETGQKSTTTPNEYAAYTSNLGLFSACLFKLHMRCIVIAVMLIGSCVESKRIVC
jgi:hypothetical protein